MPYESTGNPGGCIPLAQLAFGSDLRVSENSRPWGNRKYTRPGSFVEAASTSAGKTKLLDFSICSNCVIDQWVFVLTLRAG